MDKNERLAVIDKAKLRIKEFDIRLKHGDMVEIVEYGVDVRKGTRELYKVTFEKRETANGSFKWFFQTIKLAEV